MQIESLEVGDRDEGKRYASEQITTRSSAWKGHSLRRASETRNARERRQKRPRLKKAGRGFFVSQQNQAPIGFSLAPRYFIEHMKTSEKKKIITTNLVVWAVAILTQPLVQMVPTGSGSPPKIFSLLIPIFFMMLAGVSTYLLSAGIGKPQDE